MASMELPEFPDGLGMYDEKGATVPIRTCAVCGEQGVMRDFQVQGKTIQLCLRDGRYMAKLIEILDGMEA